MAWCFDGGGEYRSGSGAPPTLICDSTYTTTNNGSDGSNELMDIINRLEERVNVLEENERKRPPTLGFHFLKEEKVIDTQLSQSEMDVLCDLMP